MTMKNKMMVSLLLGALPLTMMAQDDMYFVPSKKNVEREAVNYGMPQSTYYSGSNRSVDDYNRRGGGSYYQVIANDTTANDIIDFSAEQGVYPDSAQTEDFALTRQMSRWDGYTPTESYWQGYSDGREDALGWHSPWYYSSFYPWYDSYWYWNDPWYYRHYGWYSPWYDPWYYGGYYWHRPYWYGGFYYGGGYHHGGGLYAHNGHTGTIDLKGGSRGRFSSSTARRSTSTSTSTARANTNVRSTSGNFNRTSSINNNSNINRSSSSGSSSFGRSSSGGGFSNGGGSRSGGVSRGGRR